MSKAAKHRFCPAVKHEISAAECGQNRGGRYACPSDCLYSPLALANYGVLLEVEGEVDRKSVERFSEKEGKSPELRKIVQQVYNAKSPHARHAFWDHRLFFHRDAAGLCFADRWRSENFPGLKNDERVVFEAKMGTHIAPLEIHRIIDDEQIEAIDLLAADPRPAIFRDRKLAALASRFSTVLAWVYPLPHYWRLNGTVITLGEMGRFEPIEVLQEIARQLGGPATEKELRLWLAENFVRVDESLQATSTMRQMQTFADMDVQFGKAIYELRAPFGACRDALDKIADVQPESLSSAERDEGFAESRVWLTEEDVVAVEGNPVVLGRVLLGQSHCRLESMGRARLGQFRKQFEKALGKKVRFTSERFDDLASEWMDKTLTPNSAIIPPQLLETPRKLAVSSSRVEMPAHGVSPEKMEAEYRARHLRAFLDDSVPALDGQTPRKAAQDPVLRPKLIRLLKHFVRQHDETNLRTGRNDDINWLLRELGAAEILFDPPPAKRAQPDNRGDGDFDDSPQDTHFPWPVLPPKPLSPKEASERLAAVYDGFETAGEALEYLKDVRSGFIDDAADLCLEAMKQEEFDLFISCLIQARFALVPRGFREPILNRERLGEAYDESIRLFRKTGKVFVPDVLTRWLAGGSQPFLIEKIGTALSSAFADMPPKYRPQPFSEFLMIVTLRHLIDELDKSIREGASPITG